MSEFSPIYPHDPIEEIGQDIFMVRGSIKMNAMMRICRNMAVIRHDGELSLINPIRLNATEEAKLCGLGDIKNIIRLGAFHGVDDPYYVSKFSCRMWSQAGGTTYTNPTIDVELTEEAQLPFPNAKLIAFKGTAQPECALLINEGSGLLLTCDAVQHYGDYSNNNFFARLLMPFIGFPKTTIVGPFWLKLMTAEGASLESEIQRLLALKFDRLLCGHGTYLGSGAHASVAAAIEKAFSTASKK